MNDIHHMNGCWKIRMKSTPGIADNLAGVNQSNCTLIEYISEEMIDFMIEHNWLYLDD